jgi:hypothetical protein
VAANQGWRCRQEWRPQATDVGVFADAAGSAVATQATKVTSCNDSTRSTAPSKDITAPMTVHRKLSYTPTARSSGVGAFIFSIVSKLSRIPSTVPTSATFAQVPGARWLIPRASNAP